MKELVEIKKILKSILFKPTYTAQDIRTTNGYINGVRNYILITILKLEINNLFYIDGFSDESVATIFRHITGKLMTERMFEETKGYCACDYVKYSDRTNEKELTFNDFYYNERCNNLKIKYSANKHYLERDYIIEVMKECLKSKNTRN